jgi:CheY-like chemotaxis protein
MRVLVVDDNEAVRAFIVEALTDEAMEVFEAAGAHEALQNLTLQPAIDVLFTDIRMPGGISGWDLARRFRGTLPDVGVVYASGFSGDGESPVAGGVFLDKPARIAQLLAAISAASDRKLAPL